MENVCTFFLKLGTDANMYFCEWNYGSGWLRLVMRSDIKNITKYVYLF